MTHDPRFPDTDGPDLPAALRLQLRGLRVDTAPARDLWPDIAARLAEPAQAPARETPAPRRWQPFPALATAAVLALAVGAAWQMRPDGGAPAPAAAVEPLVVEADAMTREFEGALRELPPLQVAAEDGATLGQLDASAAAVRAALEQAPDARFLLSQLQRIYTQRLSLSQRLARA